MFCSGIMMSNISFMGYDAIPIKNVYFEQVCFDDFKKSIVSVAKQEKFGIKKVIDDRKWIQDSKSFVEKDNGAYVACESGVLSAFVNEMKYKHGISAEQKFGFCTGGNVFIGKNYFGEKWMLVGEDDFRNYSYDDDIEYVATTYGVDKKNIFPIPQQNFHLDLFIRPIGYPYVLVNSPKLVFENLEKIQDGSIEAKELLKNAKMFYQNKDRYYCTCEQTIEALEKHGFIPIEIAGEYDKSVNFMNALVNLHSDGTVAYITNSSACGNKAYDKLNEIFKKDLLSFAPNIKRVYFVSGDKNYTDGLNYMMSSLRYGGGGLHCMSLEEPDFETWG